MSVGVRFLSGSTFGDSISATITVNTSPPPAEEPEDDTEEETQQPDNSVQNPRLTQTALYQVQVQWDPPETRFGPYNYNVSWTGPTSGSQIFAGGATRSHTIRGLVAGEYTVTIKAMYGEDSVRRTFREYASGTITVSNGEVENLTATPVSPYMMLVSWDAPIYPPDVSRYNVRIKASGAIAVNEFLESDQLEYMASGLSAETTYSVELIPIQGSYNILSSTSVDAATLAVPGAVTGLTADGIVNGLSVSWTALPESENIDRYKLEHTPSAGPVRYIDGNSYTIDGLQPGVAEKVEVRACKYTVYTGGAHQYCGPSSTTTGTPIAHSTAALAPGAPQNLRLTLTQSNSRLKVQWDAPATGWEPNEPGNEVHVYRYIVFLQDTETGKTVYKRPGHRKSQVVFRNVKSGVTYEVSARARIQDGRPDSPQYDKWVASEWVTDTITVPGGGQEPEADIGTQPHRLVWTQLEPGQPTPPNAVGEPTQHVRLNQATGEWERFYPAAECKQYEIVNPDVNRSEAGADFRKARSIAQQLAEAEAALAEQKEYRTDMLAKAGSNPSQQLIDYLDGLVAEKQSAVDARKAELAEQEARLNAKCDEVFPADEGLTEADRRWVQIARPPEEVEDEE